MKKLQKNCDLVFILFIALFPILPTYFEFLNIPMYKGLTIFFILYMIIWYKKVDVKAYAGKVAHVFKNINTLEWLILLSVGCKALSCLFNKEFVTAVWLVLLIAAGMLLVLYLDSCEKFNLAIDIIVYVAAIVGIFGILECISHFNVFSLLNNTGIELNYNPLRFGILRIISFSSHTIHYCLYCMFVLGLIFYMIINQTRGKRYIVVYFIVIINAILTLSRSALLCLFASQIMLVYLSDKKNFWKKIKKIIQVLLLVIVPICVFIPSVRNAMLSFVGMFLVVVNEKYSSLISSSYGNDNMRGIGNRLDLYAWVLEEIKGHVFWGVGPWKAFEHLYYVEVDGVSVPIIKYGIEVNYLSTLYHYGFVALVLEVISYIYIIVCGFKEQKKLMKQERKLAFSFVVAILTLSYMVSWFAVGQGTEWNIYILIVCLYLSYRRLTVKLR